MSQLAVPVILAVALGLALAAQIPEVPHADVVLRGGPESGSVQNGNNFVLTCFYNATYPGMTEETMTYDFEPHIEFWKDQVLLGAYECKWWGWRGSTIEAVRA